MEIINMSKDNIELIVNGKITVRANLKKYLGGVNADTLVARVSNEVINIINSSEYYNLVLENPEFVSQRYVINPNAYEKDIYPFSSFSSLPAFCAG